MAMAAAWFVTAHRSEIPQAWHAARHADGVWLGVAAFATVCWLVNLAAFHATAQRAVGLHPTVTVGRASTAANFLNLVTKSGGMAGATAMVAEGRKSGSSTAPVIAAYLAVVVVGEWAFTAALAASLVVMWNDRVLGGAEVVASVLFAGLVVVKLVAVVAALRSRQALRRVYSLPQRVLRRIRHGAGGGADPVRAADEFADAVDLLRGHRRALPPLALHGLAVEVLGAAQLWAVLRALGYGSFTIALPTYCVGVLFAIIGFLPAGLGFVEASMTATLVSFGVPGTTAATATVLYRVCELWLPLLLGGTAWVVTRRA